MRTVLVDDEGDLRLLMRVMLTMDGECEVVAEADNGAEGYAAWERTRPDVVVLDMRMPGETGLDTARRILAADPQQRVVMCSAYMDAAQREDARLAGVCACLEKHDIGRLADVVRAAAC